MHVAHPVQVEVTSPSRFERIQLLLRFALMVALGVFGITVGWLAWVLYLVLPVIAAIYISSSKPYPGELGAKVWAALSWLLQLAAFAILLVDRFPAGEGDPVRIDIRYTGTPTVGTALSRLATSIPSALVLMLLWCASSILWIIAMVIVLFGGTMPDAILGFQRGVLRWTARLAAYHASLVEEYPPFLLETDDDHTTASAASEAR